MNINEWKILKIQDTFSKLSSSKDGLQTKDALNRLKKFGYNEIKEKKINPALKFLKTFYGGIPFMLIAVIIISFILDKYIDAYIVIGLLMFNSIASFIEEYKADNTLDLLKQKLSINANVLRDKIWKVIPARELVPGDIIRIRIGSIVPADVKIIESNFLSVDQSTLTGESLPVTLKTGDIAYSSSIVKRGEGTAIVIATGENTFFGRTAALVKIAKGKTHLEKAIIGLLRYLLIIDIALVISIMVYVIIRGMNLLSVIPFTLLILLASVPVALPAAFTIAMAYGTERLSSKNVLVTKLESIEEASTMNVVCLDKTGTITKNELSVSEPIMKEGVSKIDIIKYAALASRKEDQDQIDLAILKAADQLEIKIDDIQRIKFIPFDPSLKRSTSIVILDGKKIEVMKGEPNTIMEICGVDKEQKQEFKQKIMDISRKGYRAIGVAYKEENKNWAFLGIIPLSDKPREDSKDLISELKALGLSTKMLTGDNIAIAEEIAIEVGIGDKILDIESLRGKSEKEIAELIDKNDGFAGVLPEDKYTIVKTLQMKGNHVGMTGDGVNDTPALKQAEVGIAVFNATDVAKNAADIVLTSPGIKAIVDAVKESRSIFERMISYTLMKISRIMQVAFFLSAAFLILGFMPIRAIQLIIMIFLNDIISITLSLDNQQYSSKPDTWDVKSIFTSSLIFSLFLIIEATILSIYGLSILKMNHSEFQTFLFLILAVSIQIITLSVRERRPMFNSRPSKWVTLGLLTSITIAVIVAHFGILMTPINLYLVILTLFTSVIFLFITDYTKVSIFSRFSEFKDL